MEMTVVFIFFLGLVFGSFLNVCIYRFPREESIVRPGSHCPHCRTPIAWQDNIPLVSFILLGGKCRHCRARISFRYFLTELASGGLWAGLWFYYGFGVFFAAGVVFLSILLAVSFTDLETGYIPDALTLPGMAAGILLSALFPVLQGSHGWSRGLLQSLAGLLAGGGSLYLIGMIGDKVFRKESMGGGDIKLLALIGSFIGLQKVILVLFFAPVLALPVALGAKLFRKAETIPFGPYLALAGAVFYLWGGHIVAEFFYY